MGRPFGRLLTLILCMMVALVGLNGCGPDPELEYTKSAMAIIDDWNVLIDRWNSSPGDSKVAVDFVELTARAQTIEPPESLADTHKILLEGMDAEQKSFETFAIGEREASAKLHDLSLKAIDLFEKDLRERDLVK